MADSEKRFQRRYKYYEILEINRNATQEELRKAFRRLAQKYHPDRNPDSREAEAKFKKINEAYQVLSNPTERAAYDSSLAECPVCWTYKVAEKAGNRWWCRVCGCEFDAFGIPLSETIERAAISGRYRARLTAFQSMQCSWCRRFFTQPFLCPDRKLHSSCFFFDKLSEEERDKFLNDEKWWWRIIDLARWTENNGVIKKCVSCGALNPNPEKPTCWNCGHNIYDLCPNCGLPTLYFDLDSNYWKCANAECYGKRFTFDREATRYSERYKRGEEHIPQDVVSTKCPNCGYNLHFDSAMLFWRCPKCRRIYTYNELREAETAEFRREPSAGPPHKTTRPQEEGKEDWTRGPFNPYYGTPSNRYKPPYEPLRRKSRGIPKIIGVSLAFILAIIIVIIAAPSSPSISVSPSNIYFAVDNGLNPPIQMLQISSSSGVVTWSATDNVQWLNLDPVNGSTDRETSIILSADISGLYPGEYAATVTFSAPDAKNTPLHVPVTLVISETKETLAIGETVDGNANNVEIYYNKQPPYSKGLPYTNIDLINSQSAVDPTWQQLVQFIASDDTDEQTYIPGVYMCGSFAETLHNNAEQEGIRAAWVAIDFEDGETHALNAFDTTDEGIVFVDCTGGGFELASPSIDKSYSYTTDYDKIAYVQLEKEYGTVSLDKADSPSHTFYETYTQDWKAYERDVDEYNQEVDEYNQNPISYSEYKRLKRIYDGLESQRETLGDYYWKPLGIVNHVEVYW